MAYNRKLADKVRAYLAEIPDIEIEEKTMFNVLNFMVNNKTCVCVGEENLMLRFDPKIQDEVSEKNGYLSMFMKGNVYKGYCYIEPEGFTDKKDFAYFMKICLDYNKIAKASKKKNKPNK